MLRTWLPKESFMWYICVFSSPMAFKSHLKVGHFLFYLFILFIIFHLYCRMMHLVVYLFKWVWNLADYRWFFTRSKSGYNFWPKFIDTSTCQFVKWIQEQECHTHLTNLCTSFLAEELTAHQFSSVFWAPYFRRYNF